jgi:general secretion pathway protein H
MARKAAKKRTPTLATGISINNTRRALGSRSRGFTLIELMIVVFIIGLTTAGAIIAFGTKQNDPELEKEAQRLDALFDYVREQAELQTRDYGFRVNDSAYSFVVFDVLGNQWRVADEDDALRERKFVGGLKPAVVVEGRSIVLDAKKKNVEDFSPQVLIFANGDVSSFEITLQRDAGGRQARIFTDEDSHIRLLLPGEILKNGKIERVSSPP